MRTTLARLALIALPALLPTLAGAAGDAGLIDAVRAKDRDAVRALLKQNVDVNVQEGDGGAALHWAAHVGDAHMVDLLLGAGARVNVQNDYGVTPLSLACVNADTPIIERLLKSGADPNIAQANGETVLMTCARTGDVEAVTLLLSHGAKVDARESSQEQTALMWAVANQHPDVVRVLLRNGANVNARTRPVEVRISRGRDVNGRSLQIGFDRPKGGFTPLLFAARSGDVDTAKLLVEAGATVNDAAADGTSVLVVAVHSGHRALAQYLMGLGANVNTAGSGYTALHAAVLRGDRVLAEELLARGADPNARLLNGTEQRRFSPRYSFDEAWTGATPFLLAAKFADVDMMRLLASKGADPKAVARDRATATMWAAGVDWEAGVKGTAEPNDRRGRTLALEEMAKEIDETATLAAVKLTLELGGDASQANAFGDTALHAAAKLHFKKVLDLLVAHGGSMELKDKRGRTPADILASE